VSELGSYTTRRALVFKTNTKGIQSEHLVFRLGFIVIFNLFEDAIHICHIYTEEKRDNFHIHGVS
jgi:hypothetical protein